MAGLAGLAFVLVACESRPKVEPATLVLNKGKIATVDDQKPEAQALAARGDTIVAVGTNEEIAAFVGPETRVVDLGDGWRFPASSRATATSPAWARPGSC